MPSLQTLDFELHEEIASGVAEMPDPTAFRKIATFHPVSP